MKLAASRTAEPNSLRATVMLAFLGSAGIYFINIAPAVVDGMQLAMGFSSRQAGMVTAANIYGAAAGAFAAALLVRRFAWRKTATWMLALLVALDLISMLARQPMALAAVRALHGLAGGFLVGTAFSVFGRTARPDRVFGMLLLVQFGFGALGILILPRVVGRLGMDAVFAAMIAFTLLTAAMLPFLPPYPAPPHPAGDGTSHRTRRPWAAFAALFLFQFANMSLAANVIRLGLSAGLTRAVVANVAGTVTALGICGALCVILLPVRLGRTVPLLVGYALNMGAFLLFLGSTDVRVFAIAGLASATTWSLIVPLLFGLSSAVDVSGHSAAIAGFASKLGLATGPLCAGFLLAGGDFRKLILVSLVAMAWSLALGGHLAWRVDRRKDVLF